MGSLVSTIISSGRLRINESSTKFHTDANLVLYCNEAQKYVVRETKCLEAIDTSNTSISGTQNYALPSDFMALRRVLYDGKKVSKTDFLEIDESGIDETDYSGTPKSYYLWNDTLYFIPIPSVTGHAIKIFYYNNPATITATTDTLETNTLYDDLLVSYMVYLAFIKDGEEQKADYQMQECNAKLSLIKKHLKEKDLSRPPRFRFSRNLSTREPMNDYYR
jgi:hypothetical protein